MIRLAFLLLATAYATAQTGVASWYGEDHRGRLMANGKPFDPDKLTAASWHYPLGTRVTVQAGRKAVTVTITDRGPAKRLNRVIDLSHAAFRKLDHPDKGLTKVTVAKICKKSVARKNKHR